MSNADQEEFWTNFSQVWVDHQAKLDASFTPVLDEVFNRADIKAGDNVLDIGCGTGTSTVQAAERVGDTGRATGVDISAPMIDRARIVAEASANATFQVSDAASSSFDTGPFDRVISRFGTMFFNNSVGAFTNILKGLRPGAQLTMACWSHLDANPWFLSPLRAAREVLGAPPPVDPDAPGPLAFRDIDRVTGILARAGFVDVSGQPVELRLTPPGTLDEVAYQCSLIGPAARTMEHFNGDESNLLEIAKHVAEDYKDFVEGDAVLVPAEINYFTAYAPR